MEVLKNTLKEDIREYIEAVRNRKKYWFLAGAIVTILLFVISLICYGDGLTKRTLISFVLCVGIGLLISFPRYNRIYFSIPMIAVYILYVPKKLFERMELPIHDMAGIQEGALLANCFVILLIYAVLLLVTQRTRLALGLGGCLCFILFLINYYVVQFRGAGLGPNDLLAVGTALGVLKSYKLTVGPEQWYSILYFLFFIVWGFWCELPHKWKRYHLTITCMSLVYLLGFYFFWNVSGYLEKHNLQGHYWNMRENQEVNGFLLGFGISFKELYMDKPQGYSNEALDEVFARIEKKEESIVEGGTEKLPNIIMIMNESWSDLRVLGNVETNEPFMPFVDSLTENVGRGNLYVDVLGGLTANTEFETLTGDSLAFMSVSAIPYQLQVNHDMSALPRVLAQQGYQTMAMHPSGGNAWNREKAYDFFGFDRFITQSEFETEFSYVRAYPSDECNYNEIIWQFEHKKDGPLFLFDVTIQNHGSFYGEMDTPVQVTTLGSTDMTTGEYNCLEMDTYLSLMKLSDDEFQRLVNYFEGVQEPTILCMFGDHQPFLNDFFYEKLFEGRNLSEEDKTNLKYITPYVIWANYDIDFGECEDISANYLGASVLEYAGVELSPYYQFLLRLKEEFPVITHRNIQQVQDIKDIKDYRILQYNQLMEKEYRRDIFQLAY